MMRNSPDQWWRYGKLGRWFRPLSNLKKCLIFIAVGAVVFSIVWIVLILIF